MTLFSFQKKIKSLELLVFLTLILQTEVINSKQKSWRSIHYTEVTWQISRYFRKSRSNYLPIIKINQVWNRKLNPNLNESLNKCTSIIYSKAMKEQLKLRKK